MTVQWQVKNYSSCRFHDLSLSGVFGQPAVGGVPIAQKGIYLQSCDRAIAHDNDFSNLHIGIERDAGFPFGAGYGAKPNFHDNTFADSVDIKYAYWTEEPRNYAVLSIQSLPTGVATVGVDVAIPPGYFDAAPIAANLTPTSTKGLDIQYDPGASTNESAHFVISTISGANFFPGGPAGFTFMAGGL